MNQKYLLIGLVFFALALGGFLSLADNFEKTLPQTPSSENITLTPAPQAEDLIVPSVEKEAAEEAIKEALAQKYAKDANEVDLSLSQIISSHAKGLVKFAGEIGGGWWLAAKVDDEWVIAADGNGTVPCEPVELYNFPPDFVPECWDEGANQLLTR